MFTALDVANMALGNTGEGEKISSFEEQSEAARACQDFYIAARNTTLKGLDWSFARELEIPLALIKTEPTRGWRYAYAYPEDCLRLLEVAGGCPYGQGLINGRRSILSNISEAYATYTSSNIPDLYEDDFALAWSFQLAILIAPRVSEGNVGNLMGRLKAGYDKVMGQAQENNANEEGPTAEVVPVSTAAGWVGI